MWYNFGMEKIRDDLKTAIWQAFEIDMAPALTVPPVETGADYASNVALMLAGRLQQKPREVAEKIAEKLATAKEYGVQIAGPGFLNFISRDGYFIEKIAEIGKNRDFFEKFISQDAYKNKKVVTEFSDPNPFKVLHVGHLYTSVVGEAISKLIEFAGARVIRANFGGDVGMHVAKAVWEMKRRDEEFEELVKREGEDRLTLASERAEFMARCYVEGTRVFEDNEKIKAEIQALNKEIFEIAMSGERESETAKVYWAGREWSYEYFKVFYERIGVKFEKFYPESTVAGKGLAKVREGLKRGVFEESDGAVVFKGEPYGLHTRVFINNMGIPTYEAKDVGLSFTKWEDWQFDESVIITGNDIIDYMKVVLKSISMMESKLAERTVHLTHGNVRLPGNEKMSSRKGNFLRAVEVLEMTKAILKEKYGEADEKIAMAALKYAFLKYKVGGNIIFDAEESVSMTGNSGPYLQYSAVRAKKILDKIEEKEEKSAEGRNIGAVADRKLLVEEKNLMKKILQYGQVLEIAVTEKAPHKVCAYLYELAQEFSRFYEKVPVVGSEFETERAQIVTGYYWTMEHGLKLMGIEVPERM